MDFYILGIETSCDDTSIAILKNSKVIDCITLSSEAKIRKYGGIIPEIASREHAKNINKIFKKILKINNIKLSQINLIAYTSKPGMINSLHIAKTFAKTLSWYFNIEVIGINHIYGHIFSPFINHKKVTFPFLSLIVSGGTTAIYKIDSVRKISILNETRDDALGEVYDKIGRYLNLKYPGGPEIDKIFNINKSTIKYKMPNPDDDFSFSGIKSNIRNYILKNRENLDIVLVASSFQLWAINMLLEKIKHYSKKFHIDTITIGGGVSSNLFFRKKTKDSNLKYLFPNKEFSCDNAAMIAYLAYLNKIY